MSTTLASDSFPPASFSKDLPWFLGFPDSSIGKESACNAGDPGSIPGLGRSTGEGIGYPFQYSWASLVAQLVKNLPAMQETWVGKIPWKRERLTTPVFWPGEFHELYSPLVRKESTRLHFHFSFFTLILLFNSNPKHLFQHSQFSLLYSAPYFSFLILFITF